MLHRHAALPSTMEEAHRLAEAGAASGEAVVADRQEAGRGRQGKAWLSPVGGLWLSVVTRPDAAAGLDAVSVRVGLALAEALAGEMGGLPRIGLKWPNDLVVGGRKLGGILVEARWKGERCLWTVVGVGLNVRNPVATDLAGIATTMAEWGPAPDPAALAPVVAAAVTGAVRGGPLDDLELAAWAARDTLRGRMIATPAAGLVEGITPDGALVVRDDAGSRHECRGGVVAHTD